MSATFNMTRDQIINSAARKIGEFDPDSVTTLTATQITNAAEDLNVMLKAFMGHGLDLWTSAFANVFLQPNQRTYTLGTSSLDNAAYTTLNQATNVVVTQLATSAAASATSITVNNSTGLVSGQSIGIALDTLSTFWTTVVSVVGTTVTITLGLPSGASAANWVYAYTQKIDRPLRIVDAFIRQNNQNDVPVEIITRAQYVKFGLKSSPGRPTQLYYDPQLTSMANGGVIYIYPTEFAASDVLYIDCQRPIGDVNTSSDNIDFPQEWLEAIIWGLAVRMCPEFGVPDSTYNRCVSQAEKSLALAMSFDQEVGSIFLQPQRWQYVDD